MTSILIAIHELHHSLIGSLEEQAEAVSPLGFPAFLHAPVNLNKFCYLAIFPLQLQKCSAKQAEEIKQLLFIYNYKI